MKKNIFIAIGLLVFALGLASTTAWRMKKWEGGLGKENIFKSETFGLQNLSEQLGKISPASEETFQEFISPDGKFRIKYPLGWLAITQKDILDALTPEEWMQKYNLQTLLLASAAQEEESGQLIVYEGNFDLSIEEIIEEMKKIVGSYGWEMKIMESDIKENEGIFEAGYQIPDSPNLRSKEKILRNGREVFLITFMVPENVWPDLTEEINYVINSAELLTEKEK